VTRSRDKRRAVRKMEVDPPGSPCGGRLQTAMSCYGRTAAVVNVMVNGVAFRSRHVGMRETSASEPLITHRNFSDGIETGEVCLPGKSMAATYLLAMRCPVYRRRDSHSGFLTELVNLVGDVKGKSTRG